jgi:hypothetical protein
MANRRPVMIYGPNGPELVYVDPAEYQRETGMYMGSNTDFMGSGQAVQLTPGFTILDSAYNPGPVFMIGGGSPLVISY